MKQPDMQRLLEQAQQVQKALQSAQADLANRIFTGTSGGGAVTATVTGDQRVVSIDISPDVIDPSDREMLADLVVAAVNNALNNAAEAANDELGGITGGLGGLIT